MASHAPFGTWESPITSEQIVTKSIWLGQIMLDGPDVLWEETRPEEGGRTVVVRRDQQGGTSDLLPQPWNARTKVHEYGGGSFLCHEGVLYFSNFADQRLYRLAPGGEPEPLTPSVDLRYADYVMDARRNRLIGIREDHTAAGEPVNTVVAIPLAGESSDCLPGGDVLVSGNDFYSTPRLSPDGTQLCWLAWDHPNMPWDGCQLWLAEVRADGGLGEPRLIAGGPTESIFQPTWSPDGELYFVSDASGWWNLYRWAGQVEPLLPMAAEFGWPQWLFGMSRFAFESADRLACLYFSDGRHYLAILDTRTGEFTPLETGFTSYGACIAAAPGRVVGLAGSATMDFGVVEIDLANGSTSVLRDPANEPIDVGYISVAQPIEFPTTNGLTAHAYYYPPCNRDFAGPQGEAPPLIVESHGGPTGGYDSALFLETQFWTSRGFAVVQVNYGGSTGYGRDYRERLRGQWGIVDVDDCVNAARHLARIGAVDPNRLIIKGASAGGYTTLAALAFRDVFHAGACYYGVSDAEALAQETHKFESRYLDGLIGPYPQDRDVYVARSAIHFTDQLNCALILFQGSEDEVVPPAQSQLMYEAVRAKGLPVAYLEFPGEQHGFRRAENLKRCLDAELYFYSRVFGFSPADAIEPVEIANEPH